MSYIATDSLKALLTVMVRWAATVEAMARDKATKEIISEEETWEFKERSVKLIVWPSSHASYIAYAECTVVELSSSTFSA
jgi:hypothetical protein